MLTIQSAILISRLFPELFFLSSKKCSTASFNKHNTSSGVTATEFDWI